MSPPPGEGGLGQGVGPLLTPWVQAKSITRNHFIYLLQLSEFQMFSVLRVCLTPSSSPSQAAVGPSQSLDDFHHTSSWVRKVSF